MFVIKEDRYLWFNQKSFDQPLNFELLGTLIGMAIYNNILVDINFPLVVYKKLK
jgi:ubiquitin-protein ligase E3 A